MYQLEELRDIFLKYLASNAYKGNPHSLYAPVDYIMGLDGKRVRPCLVLAGHNLYSEDVSKSLAAAHAIEIFHNFSLVHDDIMDKAPLRRGKETVHIKYDEDTAILSGDVMLILAYRFFESYDATLYKEMTSLFTKTSIEVCEGQRMDMDFEILDNVEIDDYLKMIEYKTAVLLAASLKIGALIGGASKIDADHLYEFGRNIGIAFQIQDDLLDTFGDDPKVGKQIGGDILNNKKTYLYLKALELLPEADSQKLRDIYASKIELPDEQKISEVTKLKKSAAVHVYSEEVKEAYLTLGISHLDAVEVPEEKKEMLRNFAQFLLQRKF